MLYFPKKISWQSPQQPYTAQSAQDMVSERLLTLRGAITIRGRGLVLVLRETSLSIGYFFFTRERERQFRGLFSLAGRRISLPMTSSERATDRWELPFWTWTFTSKRHKVTTGPGPHIWKSVLRFLLNFYNVHPKTLTEYKKKTVPF